MHGKITHPQHGKSHSTRPVRSRETIMGNSESKRNRRIDCQIWKRWIATQQIGLKLRDQHAIPLIKPITNKGIAQVLDENKSSQEIPEDLDNIVRKAVGLQNHLKSNRG